MLRLLPLVSGERARRTEEDGLSGGGRARRRRSVQRVHKVVRPREVWEGDIGQDGRVGATISLQCRCAVVEKDKTETRGQVPKEEERRAPEEDGSAGAGRADGGERGPTGSEDLDQRDQGHTPEGDVDGLHGCDVGMEVSVEVRGRGVCLGMVDCQVLWKKVVNVSGKKKREKKQEEQRRYSNPYDNSRGCFY